MKRIPKGSESIYQKLSQKIDRPTSAPQNDPAFIMLQKTIGNQAVLQFINDLAVNEQSSQLKHESKKQSYEQNLGVIQGKFTFNIDKDNLTVKDTEYVRDKSTKYLSSNKDYKHTTADSVKQDMWRGMNGMPITDFCQKLIGICEQYLELPGMNLLDAHPLTHFKPEEIEPMSSSILVENFELFTKVTTTMKKLMDDLQPYPAIDLANLEESKRKEAAFDMWSISTDLIRSMEAFRDLMPLVNVVAGIQKRGQEKEALEILHGKRIGTNLEALWLLFDFEAIDDMISEMENEDEIETAISDSIPWLEIEFLKPQMDYFRIPFNPENAVNYIAATMLGNHIKLVKISYPEAANEANIEDKDVMMNVLTKKKVSINKELVITIMQKLGVI
ncbi:hypothetical protein [Bacillus horti]|uniref:Uncharacterized protein n=1 Tax=Caldalkalibacillus horti TaxID=77523 RepID=A0ABT9VUN8_9BACI|nr:hypothetical protein [Bacillus horti]MDQ0164552.1 hypothetical protein [Bacillus horti]